MFVRQLIGSGAGQIIEVPYGVGTTIIANGTAQAVTDEEVSEAGFDPVPKPFVPPEETLIANYQFPVDESGMGFNVLDPSGVPMRAGEPPFQNLLQARDWAVDHARGSKGLPELTDEERAARDAFRQEQQRRQDIAAGRDARDDVMVPADWESLHHNQRKKLARDISGKDPENAAQANEVIAAEMQRRNGPEPV